MQSMIWDWRGDCTMPRRPTMKNYRTQVCILGLLSVSALLNAQFQLPYSQYSVLGAGDHQASSPDHIVVGSDGALWFTLFAEAIGENDKIGRITAAGVVTEYSTLTPNSSVFGLTAGPDGAMWYSLWIRDRSGGKIGRISADGVITESPLPIPGSMPQSITTGSDGALWFLLQVTNGNSMIGRITTAGVFTAYPAIGAEDIVAGPDGALWFMFGGPTIGIGRITTAGAVTVYPISANQNSFQENLIVGPDGALWFTDPFDGGNYIVRVTTAGAFTRYPVSGPPQAIAVGSDGALWFSFLNEGSSIGRITTAGIVTTYPLQAPQLVYLSSMTTGPDGALWATDATGWISRITISAVPSPTISQPSVPLGQVGVPYSAALSAFGGMAPYSHWTVSSGSLPQGLALDSTTGAISGAAAAAGTFTFGVTVQDSAGATSAEQAVLITINAAVPGINFVGSMPHLAAEENWTTTFTLVNKGGVQVTARLSLYGDLDSGTLALPLIFPQQPGGNPVLTASIDRSISPHASLSVQTAGPETVPVKVGSAELSGSGLMDGFAIFHHNQTGQETVVPLEMPVANSFTQEFVFDNSDGSVLGLALANPMSQEVGVSISISDENGVPLQGDAIYVPANGHVSFVLPARYPTTANIRGTIEFATNHVTQINVLGMRFSAPNNALTTIPPLRADQPGGGSVAHVATGNGWKTTFVLVNFNTTPDGVALPSPIQLNFFDDNGNPLALPIGFPQTTSGTSAVTSSVQQTLAPNTTLIIESAAPLSDPAPTVGSAQLSGNGKVAGFVMFRYEPNGQEAVVPFENRNAGGYLLTFDNTAGTATGVAINSVSTQAVDVLVVIRDDAGSQIATDTLHLAANGHSAFTLATDKYPVTANIRGTIEFDTPAGAQIGALAFRIPLGHTFTTLPAMTVSGKCVPTILGCF